MKQFLSFALVGGIATLGHYAVLVILAEAFAVPPVAASAAGFVTGGVISYLLSYAHVFASRAPHGAAAPRFLAVALAGLGFNSAIMWTLAHGLGVHYLPSQVVATGAVMIWSFLAHRFWTFAAPRPG